ncbi:MAG: hypothetical protein ACHQCF_02115 [Solirubrobacterales bacterium]
MTRRPLLLALPTIAVLSAAIAGGAVSAMPRADSHCTGKSIRTAVVSFTRAFDQGDEESLEALFAPAPEFQWYTTPGPGRRVAKGARGRASLVGYFQARHAKQDNLDLTSFSFNGNSPHWGNFSFTMRHSASDYIGGKAFPQGGKGAAVCDSEGVRFIVFTFGEPGRRH